MKNRPVDPTTRPRVIAHVRNPDTPDLVALCLLAARDPHVCVTWPDEFDPDEAPLLVWSMLRTLRYVPDRDDQTVRAPHVLMDTGVGDCKSYAVCAAKVLQAAGYQTALRFVSNRPGAPVEHVYCVAWRNGREYIVDGVMKKFNEAPPDCGYFDIGL